TAVANTRTYDGATDAAAVPTVSGLLGSDTVTGLSEFYNNNKNVGTGKTLSVQNYTINDGNGGKNYTVTTVNNTAGVVNNAPLTITAVTNTKTYDANTTANAAPSITGLQLGDTVTNLTETYSNANVGTGKSLSVATWLVNDGNNGGNYVVGTVANTSGVINK